MIRYRPKYEIASLRDALMGLIPIPTLRKSEIFLYGVIEIKPLVYLHREIMSNFAK